MASVDKVKIGDITYDMSPSSTGVLNGYVSNDNGTPPAWTDVSPITTSDTNSSIFSKLTTMVRNVRYLYNKLGTTDFSATGSDTVTGALSSMQSTIDNKAPATHSHTVSDLPVSSSQVNSTNYVPTCALLYSMNERLESIGDMSTQLEGISAKIDRLWSRYYDSVDLGTFGEYDIDMMLTEYTHENGYGDLAIGNYFTIQDGTYNVVWEIAGFDLEHNRKAADGTVYDNGYGICLIPKTQVTTGQWNTINNASSTQGGYKSSYMHKTVLPGIVTTLKNVLGDHIVNRNVLLSSTVNNSNGNGYSSAYTWTTAYATLMSVGQMTGKFASYNNKYDDGEANYKLPLFNTENYKTGSNFWSRGVRSGSSAWHVNSDGNFGNAIGTSSTLGVRPLIYLR